MILYNPTPGTDYVITPFLYTIYLIVVLVFFSLKFRHQKQTFHYTMVILAFFLESLTMSASNVRQIYGTGTCFTYFESRIVYYCNFFLISLTLYYWVKDFSRKEAEVINIFILKCIFIAVNIGVLLFIVVAFLIYKISDPKCTGEGTIPKYICTWSTLICLFFIELFCHIINIIRQHSTCHIHICICCICVLEILPSSLTLHIKRIIQITHHFPCGVSDYHYREYH